MTAGNSSHLQHWLEAQRKQEMRETTNDDQTVYTYIPRHSNETSAAPVAPASSTMPAPVNVAPAPTHTTQPAPVPMMQFFHAPAEQVYPSVSHPCYHPFVYSTYAHYMPATPAAMPPQQSQSDNQYVYIPPYMQGYPAHASYYAHPAAYNPPAQRATLPTTYHQPWYGRTRAEVAADEAYYAATGTAGKRDMPFRPDAKEDDLFYVWMEADGEYQLRTFAAILGMTGEWRKKKGQFYFVQAKE